MKSRQERKVEQPSTPTATPAPTTQKVKLFTGFKKGIKTPPGKQ